MNMKKFFLIAIPLILVAIPVYFIMSLTGKTPKNGLKVYVVVAPQAYLAKKIAGNHAEVKILLPEGKEPHDYTPSPKAVADVCTAQLFFSIGLPVEKAIVARLKTDFPTSTVVDSSAGITRIMGIEHEHGEEAHEHGEEAHEHGEEHEHLQEDPHVWLNANNLNIIANNIAKALIKKDPANAADYQKNLESVEKELTTLKADLDKELQDSKGDTFYVYHPAFGYFAKTYGLTQKAVEDVGGNPRPKSIEKLIKQATADKVKVIFVQPRFNRRTTDIIAKKIGAKVEELDPLNENVVENLRKIGHALAKGSTNSQ